MALLSHLLIAVAKTSLVNSSHFVCVFKYLFIFVRALTNIYVLVFYHRFVSSEISDLTGNQSTHKWIVIVF